MPIADRRYNLKLIKDVKDAENAKDDNSLTVDNINKKIPKIPDFVAPANPSKK